MRFRHLLFGATALIALAAGAVDLSADISLRYPESETSARSYNLINSDALLFKQPGMGITVSSDSRNDRPAIRPPMAPPAPGYNVKLRGCNLRPANTNNTAIVTFRANPDYGMTTLVTGDQFRANGGGCYNGNDYYFIGYTQLFGSSIAQYYHYNASTWEMLSVRDAEEGCIGYDMTYDPTDGKIYGIFYTDDMTGYVFGTFDPETVTRTAIATLPCEYFAIAASPRGVIYAIDEDGDLNTLDKTSGKATLVGSTGVKPRFKQSADFDDATGRLYWVAAKADNTSAFYEVDTTTGAATKIFDLPDEDQIVALDVMTPEALQGAPNTADALKIDITDGSLKGRLTFTAPDYTFGGSPLTGSLSYEVTVDGTVSETGTVAAGATKTVDVEATTAGFHTLGVTTSNSTGKSPVRELKAWFGKDTPSAVANMRLTSDNTRLSLSWDAPTQGVNGGYIDAAALRYTVVRQPDNVTVATSQTATTFTESFSTSGTGVWYDVTPEADGLTGPTASSPKALTGGAMSVPYSENFDNSSANDFFTVIDVRNDGKTWEFVYDEDYNEGDMQCKYSSENAKDDWLISPPIRLESGRLYNISLDVRARSGSLYPETMEIMMATAATAEAMKADNAVTVMEEQTFRSSRFTTVTNLVQVPADGIYYIGIHATTKADSDVLAIDNLKVTQEAGSNAPAAVTDIKIVPNADGSEGLTLTFTTPSLSIAGNNLRSLSKVEIYRGETVVHTVAPVEPGKTYTWYDAAPAKGLNTYDLRAFDGDLRGLAGTASGFSGFDVPGRPKNVRVTEKDGFVGLTWEAPTEGEQGGVFDKNDLSYIVLDSESNIIMEDLTDTRWDFRPQLESEQNLYAWSVAAKTSAGIGYPANSNVIALGTPYALPFKDSFPKAINQTTPWGQYISGQGGRWFTSDTGVSPIANPQDNDGGLLTFIPKADDDEALIYSAKIDVSDAKAPVVDFWYHYAAGMTGNLAIEAAANYGNYTEVSRIDYTKAREGWNFARIPLDKIDCSGFIQFGLRASTGDATRHLHVDNLVVRDPATNDLLALDVTAAGDLKVGSETTVTATVQNIGTTTVSDYTVELWVNGMQLGSTPGTSIEPLKTATFDFKVTPTVAMSAKASFGVKVINTGDANLADNTYIGSYYDVEMPRWPVVTDLTGSYDGANVNLEWTPMTDAVLEPEHVTDKVETYEPFIIDNIGDWTTVDVDGGEGTFTIKNTSSFNVDYPNAGKPMAFQVFNPSQAGLLLVNGEGSPTGWMPHSGNQYFAAFGDTDGANDDWLISPELSGEAQTITFFARSYSDIYGLEQIEVLTSATDRNTESFERVKGIARDVPAAWTQYTVELPEGTRFFAIRCTSRNRFVLLVDDISFIPAGATPTSIAIKGYNVYRNGILLNDEIITEPRFSEPFAKKQSPKYAVTAVYDKCESNFSNIVTVNTSGIDAVDSDNLRVMASEGCIVIENGRGIDVTVCRPDGITVWKGTPATARQTIGLPQGIYIVSTKTKTVKVLVR